MKICWQFAHQKKNSCFKMILCKHWMTPNAIKGQDCQETKRKAQLQRIAFIFLTNKNKREGDIKSSATTYRYYHFCFHSPWQMSIKMWLCLYKGLAFFLHVWMHIIMHVQDELRSRIVWLVIRKYKMSNRFPNTSWFPKWCFECKCE